MTVFLSWNGNAGFGSTKIGNLLNRYVGVTIFINLLLLYSKILHLIYVIFILKWSIDRWLMYVPSGARFLYEGRRGASLIRLPVTPSHTRVAVHLLLRSATSTSWDCCGGAPPAPFPVNSTSPRFSSLCATEAFVRLCYSTEPYWHNREIL